MPSVKRSYNSPLRQQQAAQTRDAVVRAARELFVEQGYAATTVEQVAQRAGVSKPGVFTAVGNKQALLKAVWDVALAGDDRPVPVRERESAQRARAAGNAFGALHELAVHIATTQRRSAPVAEVLRAAASTGETELRELWRAAEDQRRAGARLMVDLLESKGELRSGLSAKEAADILAAHMGPEMYHWLVSRCRWSHQAYTRWLGTALEALLLAAPPTGLR